MSTHVSAHSKETEKLAPDLGEQDTKHQVLAGSSFPTTSLFKFVLFFTFALAMIEIILRWSKQNSGLVPNLSAYNFIWEFGPAVVFAIASGFWGRLADQIGQTTVCHRMNDSHGVTAFAIIGRILLIITIGLSFRLLELQCVKLDRKAIALLAHSEFSGAGYNSGDVNANPTLTVAGIHGLGRPYPAGTTGEHAFQPFSAAVKGREDDGIIAGIVDLFSSDLKCEVASVVNSTPKCGSATCLDNALSVTLSTPTCTEYKTSLFQRIPVNADEYYVDVAGANCADASDVPEDPQLIFVAAHWNRNNPKVSSIVCEPLYSISQAHVSLHQRNSSTFMVIPIRINNGDSEQHIPEVTPTDLAASFMSTLKNAEIPLSKLPEVSNMMGRSSNSDGVYYNAFHLVVNMLLLHSPEELFDSLLLEKVSRQVYTSITGQIANQYLLRSSHKEFEGHSFGNVSRVMVHEDFARLIEASLVALIVLVATILARIPTGNSVS